MLLRQFWIFYITFFISSWLPSTNPSFSSSPSSSPSSSSSFSSFSSSLSRSISSSLISPTTTATVTLLVDSEDDELSSYLPSIESLLESFSSSPPVLNPIRDNEDEILEGENSVEPVYRSSYRRTRFTRSYRNFGLHRVDFNIPSNVLLGENTTAPNESGPWSPWSEPSRCSRPCGGGVRSQKRYCTDTDISGRSTCTGPDTRYYSCNILPCQESIDFRAQQCSMFNNQSIPMAIGKLENIEWEPYNSRSTDRKMDEDLCSLNCKPKNGTWYTRLMQQVIDGTKCLREIDWVSGICVAGKCLPVGCDGLLGSSKVEDKCRICGGDGKECNTVSDRFAENLPPGYRDIALIPRGATYIRIEENGPSRNFLAIRDSSGRYYLNGNWTFEIAVNDFEAGGTRFEYGKKPHISPSGAFKETLYALGPLRSPLYIVMVYQENTPGIEFEYSVPSDVPVPSIFAPPDAYTYMLGSYGPCSRSCGSGVQTRPVRCVRLKTGEFVPLEYCKREVLPQLSLPCNQIDCPPAYHKGNWSACICPGIKTRAVFCEEIRARGERLVLDDSACADQVKPSSVASCTPDDCFELNTIIGNRTDPPIQYIWNTTEWSKCSSRCGPGKHIRVVTCVNLNGSRVHDSLCPSDERPESEGVCASVPCEGGVDWVTSEWSNCSVPCGPLVSTRSVLCAGTDGLIYDEKVCGLERKPADRRNCTENPGCNYSWFTNDWSSCSASCGKGVQTRHVVCGLFDDDTIKVDESKCEGQPKPITTRVCRAAVQCEAALYYGPWGPCQCGKEERTVLCLDPNNSTGSKLPLEKCNATLTVKVNDPTKTTDTNGTISDGQINVNGTKAANETISDGEMNINGTKGANETISDGEVSVNGTKYANETINGDEIVNLEGSVGSNETLEIIGVNGTSTKILAPLTLLQTNRTCEWIKPTEEDPIGTSDVAPEPTTGGTNSTVDCCQSEFGCCPNGVKPRKWDFSNCYADEKPSLVTDVEEPMISENVTTISPVNGTEDGNATIPVTEPTEQVNKTVSITPAACLTSTYGCCWDGLRPAFGPFKFGCPIDCNNTFYGCCPDRKTPKTNETGLNCPPLCLSTPFGCCDDNITEAGVNRTNCPIKPTPGPGDVEGSGGNEICLEIEGSGDGDSNSTSESSCSKPLASTVCTESADGSTNGTVCSPVTKKPLVQCNTTTFGCCPDGINARKSELDDCTCSGSEFGCCPDNKTLATGLNQEGCPCSTFPFKCCQDGYTRATGLNFEGCVCSRMLFGCCSDGITPARGPNQHGCGCNTSPFGCCPDNQTTASGPNYTGCPCRTLPQGCCPDQKTPAKGPNNEGCPCEALSHGCCFDGKTPATGPNYGGCDCTLGRFGCCPDYTTVALGPNNEGCPGGPSLDIRKAPEACKLPRERGPCRNFSIKWYYDLSYGGCVRFWYGGCDGNANRYQSEEECEKLCVNPEGYMRCNLPAVFGACGQNHTRYRFNPETRSCETFQYSGCLGNKNNFNTRSECEAFCLHPETLDHCDQPMDRGQCTRRQTRYYYDRSTDSCQPFDWGGCGGNQNNFVTVEDCHRKCGMVKKDEPLTLCKLPRAEGSCLGRYPRWFFDAVTQECREFIYTGCDGNHNRFVSKQNCEKMCNSTRTAIAPGSLLPSMPYSPQPVNPLPIDVCKMPVSTGSQECNERLVKWYYNEINKKCILFDYRGCGGNGNRFNSREECEATCSPSPSFPSQPYPSQPYPSPSYPSQPYPSPSYPSPSFPSPPSYYYPARVGPPPPEPGIDQCTLPQSRGEYCPNRTIELRWYFDSHTRSCVSFYYLGCGGTANNFASQRECSSTCSHHIISVPSSPVSPSSPSLPTDSRVTPSSSPSSPPSSSIPAPQPGWSDPSINRPSQSSYPHGWTATPYDRVNRYQSEFNKDSVSIQSCLLPTDHGSGSDSIQSFYYDPIDGVCKKFYYTGVGGNANKFATRKECEIACWSSQDICQLPSVPGGPNCSGDYSSFYYDPKQGDCLPFTFKGCERNANRFDSLILS